MKDKVRFNSVWLIILIAILLTAFYSVVIFSSAVIDLAKDLGW